MPAQTPKPQNLKAGLSREERREITKRKLAAAEAAAAATDASADAPAAAAGAPSPAAKTGLSREERREITKRKLAAAEEAPVTVVAASDERPKKCIHLARPPPDARPSAYAAGPCTDLGHWGEHGEWVYPEDKWLTCTMCSEEFVFTGERQSWFAQRAMYAPSRCAECLSAKRELKEEKRMSGRSGEGRCFACGGYGHLASRCPNPRVSADDEARKACYGCGSTEHLSRNCPHAKSAKWASGCYVCGSTSHLSRECPQRPPPICYNCGQTGHALKSCPQPQRTSGVCFAFKQGQCFKKKCIFSH